MIVLSLQVPFSFEGYFVMIWTETMTWAKINKYHKSSNWLHFERVPTELTPILELQISNKLPSNKLPLQTCEYIVIDWCLYLDYSLHIMKAKEFWKWEFFMWHVLDNFTSPLI